MAEKPTLVYADTCVYVDLITRNEGAHKDTGEPRWKIARSLFEAVDRGAVRLVASSLIEAEVLCNGKTRERQESLIAAGLGNRV